MVVSKLKWFVWMRAIIQIDLSWYDVSWYLPLISFPHFSCIQLDCHCQMATRFAAEKMLSSLCVTTKLLMISGCSTPYLSYLGFMALRNCFNKLAAVFYAIIIGHWSSELFLVATRSLLLAITLRELSIITI